MFSKASIILVKSSVPLPVQVMTLFCFCLEVNLLESKVYIHFMKSVYQLRAFKLLSEKKTLMISISFEF